MKKKVLPVSFVVYLLGVSCRPRRCSLISVQLLALHNVTVAMSSLCRRSDVVVSSSGYVVVVASCDRTRCHRTGHDVTVTGHVVFKCDRTRCHSGYVVVVSSSSVIIVVVVVVVDVVVVVVVDVVVDVVVVGARRSLDKVVVVVVVGARRS